MRNILDALFGCWHANYSFPRTTKPGQRRSEAAAVTGTYVVCLDCGKEFPYDWQEMRIVTASRSARRMVEPAESFAVK
jgi:hypothetical protein